MAPRNPDPSGAEFVLSRSFDASRELVFSAWTELQALTQWFGVKGMETHSCTLDLRPGGRFLYGMRAPTGEGMWARWIFREIVRPSKIVFVLSFSDPQGGITRPPFPASWPHEMLNTVTFEEKGGRTTVTLRSVPINATEEERKNFLDGHDSMRGGWGATLDQLVGILARKLILTRDFDAPRELVFQAWTDPKHVDHWMGPRGFRTTTRGIDVRPGGVWRYVMRGPDGTDDDNLIEYVEVVKPERLVYVHGSHAEPDQFRVTVSFDPLGAKTRLTMSFVLPSVEALEAVKKFGAVELGKQTLERLAEHLPKM